MTSLGKVRVKLSQMKMNYWERNNSDIDGLGSKAAAPLCTVMGSKVSNVTVVQPKLASNENLTTMGHAGGHHTM